MVPAALQSARFHKSWTSIPVLQFIAHFPKHSQLSSLLFHSDIFSLQESHPCSTRFNYSSLKYIWKGQQDNMYRIQCRHSIVHNRDCFVPETLHKPCRTIRFHFWYFMSKHLATHGSQHIPFMFGIHASEVCCIHEMRNYMWWQSLHTSENIPVSSSFVNATCCLQTSITSQLYNIPSIFLQSSTKFETFSKFPFPKVLFHTFRRHMLTFLSAAHDFLKRFVLITTLHKISITLSSFSFP